MAVRTYGRIELQGRQWLLSGLEPHVAIKLKALFPSVPKASGGPFPFPATPTIAMDLKWFIERYPLAGDPACLEALSRDRELFLDQQAERERILMPDYEPPRLAGLRPGMVLRPYQAQAVELLGRSGGLLLGDEVGLGKTYVTAGACLLPGALPAIVVCPGHLQAQWVRVIESFTTLTAHAVTKTKPYALPPCDVRVFRYSQLIGWSDMFAGMGCGLVAFDEVQDLRGGTSTGKGVAAKRIADSSGLRLGLSATPIYNYGAEIWSIMKFLRPDVLGRYDDFVREYCRGGSVVSDAKALGTFLRGQHALLRRTKADVGQQMPAVNRIVDMIDYERLELAAIEDVAEELALKATTGEFTQRGQAARDLDLRVRHATGVSKAKAVAKVVRVLLEGGEPVVLVGWHRDVYDIWLEALADFKPALYTGSETTSAKGRNAQAFIDGETDLLILSLRSGAGLDGLQRRCSTMVFGELDWSPGVHHQCIGRLDREGQAEPVTALFLVIDDGSDPPMMDVLGLKASQSAAIMDPLAGAQKVGRDAGNLRRLVERYLKGKAAKGFEIGPGETLSPARLACLRELAACARPTTAIPGVMEGAHLAALVQLGLADRAEPDRLGGCRYVINDAGEAALDAADLAVPSGVAA